MMVGKKILIADYDSAYLETLAGLFEAKGLQVVRAADGREAYEKYRTERPDLILVEAMLPKLHGFDLAARIHSETKGSIPVVILTGLYKGAQYRNEALRSFGAAAYLEKPIDSERIVGTVEALLREESDFDAELPDPASVASMLAEHLEKISKGESD